MNALISQAEQGRGILQQAREFQEQRQCDIQSYQIFLEDTNDWLKNIILKTYQPGFIIEKVCIYMNISKYEIFNLIWVPT